MPPQRERPNVLILLMDSVPARRMGCYGYGRPVSPNIDALAAEGVRFADAVSTGCMSPPAHASLFTGLYPDRHGVLIKASTLREGIPTMAEIFSAAGYQTWCVTNKLDVGSETGLDRGFDRVVEMCKRWGWPWASIRFRLMRATMNLYGAADDGAAFSHRILLKWITGRGKGGRPFLAFVNYADAHYPYGAPGSFRYRFAPRRFSISKTRRLFLTSASSERVCYGGIPLEQEDLEGMSDLFDGGVAYLDHRIGELVGRLRESGLLDSTILVVLSDHGEYLGDRGYIGHGMGLYEPVLRIPLIMRWPSGIPGGTVEKRPVQISDLLPTLTALAGIEWRGSGRLDGMSLVPLGREGGYHEDLTAFFPGQTMIRNGMMKYLRGENGAGELYDLGADPDESRNLAEERPELVRLLRSRLEGLLSRQDRIEANARS